MTKADILRGRGNGHMVYITGRQSGKTAQELEKFKNETGYNGRLVRRKDITNNKDTDKPIDYSFQLAVYQAAFKHFNITAEDIEDMGFYNFAKEIVGEPDFNYIPPEKFKEEKEKFDLYIKGLWGIQEGDNDEKV